MAATGSSTIRACSRRRADARARHDLRPQRPAAGDQPSGRDRARWTTIYRAAGIAPASGCEPAQSRCYPLGGFAFHVLGDWNAQTNWAARNSSYIERDSDAQLKGYDDHARDVEVVNPRTGKRHAGDLARLPRAAAARPPALLAAAAPRSTALQARDRDVHTSIDARLQIRARPALRDQIVAGKNARGAAVVLDPASGEVLASVSYPWPSRRGEAGSRWDAGTHGCSTARATVSTRRVGVQAGDRRGGAEEWWRG